MSKSKRKNWNISLRKHHTVRIKLADGTVIDLFCDSDRRGKFLLVNAPFTADVRRLETEPAPARIDPAQIKAGTAFVEVIDHA